MSPIRWGAMETRMGVEDLVLEKRRLTRATLEALLHPERMMHPGQAPETSPVKPG
jgi:aspartate ammonia-lyase